MNLTEAAVQLEALRRTKGFSEIISDPPPPIPGPEYDDILRWLTPAPAGSTLLGLCQDGLPLLLDLTSNSPGGLLLLDPRPDRSRALLSGIIASVIHLSPPESIEITLISPKLNEFPYPPEGALAFRWADPGENSAMELLYEFLAVAGDQTWEELDGVLRLLILDEAHQTLARLDRYTQDLLTWAAAKGPERGCRVIASTESIDSHDLTKAFLASFDVRICGHHPDSRSSLQPVAPQIDPAIHARDGYYSIKLAGKATPFWLPPQSLV